MVRRQWRTCIGSLVLLACLVCFSAALALHHGLGSPAVGLLVALRAWLTMVVGLTAPRKLRCTEEEVVSAVLGWWEDLLATDASQQWVQVLVDGLVTVAATLGKADMAAVCVEPSLVVTTTPPQGLSCWPVRLGAGEPVRGTEPTVVRAVFVCGRRVRVRAGRPFGAVRLVAVVVVKWKPSLHRRGAAQRARTSTATGA